MYHNSNNNISKKEEILVIYGYARVSSTDQNLATQLEQLERYGVDEIFSEKVIGVAKKREKLDQLLEKLQSGDTLVITRMDRLGRSSKQLLDLVEEFKERNVHLVILSPNIDTRDEIWGKFFLTVMSAFSELERMIIKEKVRNGIAIAKRNGKYKGRLRKYTKNHAGLNHAIELYKTGNYTVNQICEITKISRATFYRRMKEYDIDAVSSKE
jgi:DNA invertase Pin-like site-specific DNA recombinase